MRASNVKGSPECYTAIVHACSQIGELDYALTVYDDLKQDGVEPDEVYSRVFTLIRKCHKLLVVMRWLFNV